MTFRQLIIATLSFKVLINLHRGTRFLSESTFFPTYSWNVLMLSVTWIYLRCCNKSPLCRQYSSIFSFE